MSKTAAERQRECRERKRDIPQNVTCPDVTPNPLAIPGDPDYVGCCKLVDGVWVVGNTRPEIKHMSDDELIRRLHYLKDWKQSPEYKEVLRRRGSNEQALQAAGACL